MTRSSPPARRSPAPRASDGGARGTFRSAFRLAGTAALCALAAVPGCSAAPAGPPGAVASAPATPAPAREAAPDRHRTAGERAGADGRAEGRPGDQAAERAEKRAADPVRVRIPALSVDAPVGPLDVGRDRVLPPPKAPGDAGWWRGGPEPGEAGPAVIVGHLDSRTGPAVFYRLGALHPGDRALVDRADGTTAVFTARRLENVAQDDFPTDRVYGDTGGRPALRLITCGGAYDRAEQHYEENLIVFAELTSVRGG